MIWEADTTPATRQARLAARIAAHGCTVSGPVPPEHSWVLAEAARGVAAYLCHQETSSAPEESPETMRLLARALGSCNSRRLACRLVLHNQGIVQSACWALAGNQPFWVLDVQQLARHAGYAIELTLFRSLDTVLDAMIDVWNSASGHGVLALRGLLAGTRASLGRQAPHRQQVTLARELRLRCLRRLEQQGSRHGWTAIPHVVNLD